MKNFLFRTENDRTAAIIILLCMTIFAVGSGLGISYMFEYNFYKPNDNGITAKNVAVQLYSAEDTEKAKNYFTALVQLDDNEKIREFKKDYNVLIQPSNDMASTVRYYEQAFSTEKTNFVFNVTDAMGNIWFTSFENSDEEEKEALQRMFDDPNEFVGSSAMFLCGTNGKMIPLTLNYIIVTDHTLQVNDKYSQSFKWIEAANNLKYAVFVVLLISALCILFLLSIIAINSGMSDSETGEIIPDAIDRIPLDICSIFIIAVFALVWIIVGLTSAADVDMVTQNIIAIIVFCVMMVILMLFLNTVSVRIKIGKFYRNTLIYRLFLLFKRKTPRKIRRALDTKQNTFKKLAFGLAALVLFEGAILGVIVYFGFVKAPEKLETVIKLFLLLWGASRIIIIPIFALIAFNLGYVNDETRKLAQGIMGDDIAAHISVSAIKSHGRNLDKIKEEINKAMEQELRSEKLRSELITNISHDIKTPLTSIKNFVDLLKNSDLTEEEKNEYLSILSKNTDKLGTLLDNLIEVSKITAGKVKVDLQKTSLNIMLMQSIEEYSFKFKQSELEPKVFIPDKDIFVPADGDCLWRVLSNLFSNVSKYAEPNTEVDISLSEFDSKAIISISNVSKSEITDEQSVDLTARFTRGDTSRNTEGYGLGLSIAKSLTELQKASFRVEAAKKHFSVSIVFDTVE